MNSSNVKITLDSIIRRTLAKNHLTTHYYMPFLIYAIAGLKKISYISLPKTKTVKLTAVDGVFTVPNDCIKPQEIFELIGDKKRQYIEDPKGAKVTGPFSDYSEAVEAAGLWSEEGVFQGREFDRSRPFKNTYVAIDEETFRLTSENSATEVYIQYTTIPTSIGVASLVDPLAEECISEYIKWQWVMNGKVKRLDVQLFKDNYRVAHEHFRAAIYNTSGEMISRATRKAVN